MNNQSGQLAKRESAPVARASQITYTAPLSFHETMQLADAIAKSGSFPNIRTKEQAAVKILFGQELGIGPMSAISQIHIVEGKPTMDATLVGSQVRKSGRYDFKVLESTDKACRIQFYDAGKSVGVESFTIEDAERAGLARKTNWERYPKAMLRSRCMTSGSRTYCPDVFGGAVYTPEELGASTIVDDSGTMRVAEPSRREESAGNAPSTAERAIAPNADEDIIQTAETDRLGDSARTEAERRRAIGIAYEAVGYRRGDPVTAAVSARAREAVQRVCGKPIEETPDAWNAFSDDELLLSASEMAANGIPANPEEPQ